MSKESVGCDVTSVSSIFSVINLEEKSSVTTGRVQRANEIRSIICEIVYSFVQGGLLTILYAERFGCHASVRNKRLLLRFTAHSADAIALLLQHSHVTHCYYYLAICLVDQKFF